MKTKLTPVLALGLNLVLIAAAQAQRMPQDSWYFAKEAASGASPKFSYLADSDVGPDGNLYVADAGDGHVKVIGRRGELLRAWDGVSSGSPGNYFRPRGVDVAADGKVYISDDAGARLLVFDNQGRFLRSIGRKGSGEGTWNSGPWCIAVDSKGQVYASHDSSKVTVFGPDGSYLRSLGGEASGDAQLGLVQGLEVLSDDRIAVLDYYGGQIKIFSSAGAFLTSFPIGGISARFAVSPAGDFYVTYLYHQPTKKFSPSGTEITTPNIGGWSPITVAQDRIFVLSVNPNNYVSDSIYVYDSNSVYLDQWGFSGSISAPSTFGVATDKHGAIYVADKDRSEIRKFSPDLNFLSAFGGPGADNGKFQGLCSLAISGSDRIYALEQSNNRVQIFDLSGNYVSQFGSAGNGNSQFDSPKGIAVGKSNKIYIADRGNHRVQIFDADGGYLGKFGRQGSFDGEFESPHDVAVFPNGDVAVADYGNKRIQIFDHEGNFLSKKNYMDLLQEVAVNFSYLGNDANMNRPEQISVGNDGLLYVSAYISVYREENRAGKRIRESRYGYPILVADGNLKGLKFWFPPISADIEIQGPSEEHYRFDAGRFVGPMLVDGTGDLVAAQGDGFFRRWKRTFRTVHPEPANALPLPTIVAQQRRPGTSLVDVEYTVKDADNTTVQTAALAFQNGGNSLADVIPITSFAEGTASKLGTNIATGETHKFTWDVARDWSTDFGEVQLEILAKDGRGLLNLDFIQIPATGDQPALKISRSPLNDNDFLSVWYWLIATEDSDIRFSNGKVYSSDEAAGGLDTVTATYFENGDLTGQSFSRQESVPLSPTTLWTEPVSGVPFLARSIRWAGSLVPKKTGTIRIDVSALGVLRIYINSALRVSNQGSTSFTLDGNEGIPIPMVVEITPSTWSGYEEHRRISFSITEPGDSERPLAASDFQGVNPLAWMQTTSDQGRAYLLQKMGLREATATEVLRAKEAGTPGVINQWDPKLRVGPDERPAKINAYGFDTGADGYWVVPVSGN
jgi:sugar lactone lactonase YvrE